MTNSEMPGNDIGCIESDEFGNMWIGVNGDCCYLIKFNGINLEEKYSVGPIMLPDSKHIFLIRSMITSDDKGIMWLGTSNGLIEFDGTSFTRWDKTNSYLPGNFIQDIEIDSEGNKWIATGYPSGIASETYGLVKIDTDWKVTTFDTLNSQIPSNDVWCIEIDKYDNIWVGTSRYAWAPYGGKGLAKFDGTTWTLYNVNNTGLPSNNIIDIKIDDVDNKWILTESGLAKYDNLSWEVYNREEEDYWAVSCLAIDNSGSKFIGTGASTSATLGMLRFDGTVWSQFDENNSGLPSHHICNICIDKFNNKWIGTNYGDSGTGAGLVIFNEGGVVTDIKGVFSVNPNHYKLKQNYPNPFNPSTTIEYSIPETSNVTLKVFGLLGSEVATLVNKIQTQGNHEVEFNASGLTSGLYFYRLKTGNLVETKKMILLN
jgi:ligand-binding sensor domain-containing protein